MNKVYIHTEFIKLQQVLKLAGLIDQGSDVKYFLSAGKGACKRRGCNRTR